MTPYTAESSIVGQPQATVQQATAYMERFPCGEYSGWDTGVIVRGYFAIAQRVGVDPVLAVAQMCHETGHLSAALAQRRNKDGEQLRNPAGIGVDGRWSRTAKPGYVWDEDRQIYRACIGFSDWQEQSIPAHVGRLLAYARRDDELSIDQWALVAAALSYRPLARIARGSARTIKQLGAMYNPVNAGKARKDWIITGWATPGVSYGASIARIANAITKVQA